MAGFLTFPVICTAFLLIFGLLIGFLKKSLKARSNGQTKECQEKRADDKESESGVIKCADTIVSLSVLVLRTIVGISKIASSEACQRDAQRQYRAYRHIHFPQFSIWFLSFLWSATGVYWWHRLAISLWLAINSWQLIEHKKGNLKIENRWKMRSHYVLHWRKWSGQIAKRKIAQTFVSYNQERSYVSLCIVCPHLISFNILQSPYFLIYC